jgi:hypothetical protein
MVSNSVVDLPQLLGEQLIFHWSRLSRPRLEGLTDEEYFGEPVPECWSLRPRRNGDCQVVGRLVMDLESTEADPPPFTTIAWRLAHVNRHILGARAQRLFGAPDLDQRPLAETAMDALAELDEEFERWRQGVAAMTDSWLAEPCGADEPYFKDRPLATLVLHVNREVLCHCAEISLLRDLYARVRPEVPDHLQS